jgi:hypothetical protein
VTDARPAGTRRGTKFHLGFHTGKKGPEIEKAASAAEIAADGCDIAQTAVSDVPYRLGERFGQAGRRKTQNAGKGRAGSHLEKLLGPYGFTQFLNLGDRSHLLGKLYRPGRLGSNYGGTARHEENFGVFSKEFEYFINIVRKEYFAKLHG